MAAPKARSPRSAERAPEPPLHRAASASILPAKHLQTIGHLLLAIDIARWMPPAQFESRAEALAAMLTAPAGPGGVRMPGDARWAEYARSERDGVLIEEHALAQIEQLARDLDVALDWD